MTRGRPKRYEGMRVVTTVRIEPQNWEWVKRKAGAEFSAILNAAINERRVDSENGPSARFVRECRRFGLSDSEIERILGFRTAHDLSRDSKSVPVTPVAFLPLADSKPYRENSSQEEPNRSEGGG